MAPAKESIELANQILKVTTELEGFLEEQKAPSLSFDGNARPRPALSKELQKSVNEALFNIERLTALLSGPQEWLRLQYGRALDLTSLHALYRFSIPAHLPKDGSVAIKDLAARCDVDQETLATLLQHAVTKYNILQPQPGHVSHSSVSALLASSKQQNDLLGHICEDYWPALVHTVDAIQKWPEPMHQKPPHHSGHNFAERTEVPFFETLTKNPERAARFDSAMSLFQRLPGWEAEFALDWSGWQSLDTSSVVVDVGGGDGTFAIALAKKYPKIGKIIVQDLSHVIERAQASIPSELKERIITQPHSFFETQPEKGADVYFLRKICHDWPDISASNILGAIVPALKPSSRIIINDECVPDPGSLPNIREWQTRSRAIALMAMNNGKERTAEDWNNLVAAADPRLTISARVQSDTNTLALLEVTLRGSS